MPSRTRNAIIARFKSVPTFSATVDSNNRRNAVIVFSREFLGIGK